MRQLNAEPKPVYKVGLIRGRKGYGYSKVTPCSGQARAF
jgi:hypothetical protein